MTTPIYGCAGCATTAGAGACPVHGQKFYPLRPTPESKTPLTDITRRILELKDQEIARLKLQVGELQKVLVKISNARASGCSTGEAMSKIECWAREALDKPGTCVDDQHRETECRCDHMIAHCCSHHCCCFAKKEPS